MAVRGIPQTQTVKRLLKPVDVGVQASETPDKLFAALFFLL